MTHVETSPYYPQSNGKIERYHRTIKADCIREKTIESVDDARRIVQHFQFTLNRNKNSSAAPEHPITCRNNSASDFFAKSTGCRLLLTRGNNSNVKRNQDRKAMEKYAMFGSGNSKDKLQEKYNRLMQESYELSTVNRKKSDLKRAEAEEIGKQLDELDTKS